MQLNENFYGLYVRRVVLITVTIIQFKSFCVWIAKTFTITAIRISVSYNLFYSHIETCPAM